MANVPITSLPVASAPAMDDYLILQGSSTQRIKWSTLLDKLWPVGSIYQSANSTSPASFLGGTWERIKDRFLLAAGDTYAAGSTGGEAAHTLTVSELPTHNFSISGLGLSAKGSGRIRLRSQGDGNFVVEDSGGTIWSTGIGTTKDAKYSYFTVGDGSTNTSTLGDSQPHNNMPPYIAKYIWQRIA